MDQRAKMLLTMFCVQFAAVGALIFGLGATYDSGKKTDMVLTKQHVAQVYDRLYETHPLRPGSTTSKPEVIFGLPPDSKKKENDVFTEAGSYIAAFPQEVGHKIYLTPDKLCPPNVGLDAGIKAYLGHKFNFGCMNVDEAIKHELAHHFFGEQEQRLGLGGWLGFYNLGDEFSVEILRSAHDEVRDPDRVSTALAKKMIIEGTGRYYERKRENIPAYNPVPLSEFYRTNGEFALEKVYNEYSQGLTLVAPILDKYGKQGIDRMLQNPPKINSLYDLPAWQQRILAMK